MYMCIVSNMYRIEYVSYRIRIVLARSVSNMYHIDRIAPALKKLELSL